MNLNLNIHTDGGSRGNPGPAAVGVVIKESSGKLIHQFGQAIGKATNNIAEYQGVVVALEYLLEQNLKLGAIHFFLDSTLVVNQLSGLWKIKDANLREKVIKVRELEGALNCPINYTAVSREKNTQADLLLNLALDNH